MGLARVHLRIEGHVQGVFFRHQARQRAQSLGLSGWVRNCPDGTVEAVAEGQEDALQRFIAWANQGPELAQVDRVHVEREPARGETGAFRVAG